MLRRILTVAALAAAVVSFAVVQPAAAAELAKGGNLLSAMFHFGQADLATPESGNGFITAYDHSEWGGQLEWQHATSDKWALALSIGIGAASENDKPGDNATPGDEEFKYTQKSMQARVGFDRYANIGDGLVLYGGPGFQYWSGHANFEQGTSEVESEDATRFAIDGRMGMHADLSSRLGLNGHVGMYLGRASAEDAGAKADWSVTGTEGAMGLDFRF